MFTTGFMFIIIIITFLGPWMLMPGDKQHLNTKHTHMDVEEKRIKLHRN